MNLTVPRSVRSIVSPATHRRRLICRNSCASLYSSLSKLDSAVSVTQRIKIPLFLRSAVSSATLSDIQRWRSWAEDLAISAGSNFVELDHGPGLDLLFREIGWLLEDVVEDFPKFRYRILTQSHNLTDLQTNLDTTHASNYEKSERLKFPGDGSSKSSCTLKLRVNLNVLYRLWEKRIEERTPFQYVVGCEHWKDLILSVQEGVLIPRPETVMIVDLVGEMIRKHKALGQGVWADLGTGSGAIGIGIARILGNRGRVIATDMSEMAVLVSHFNVRRYGLQDKVEIRKGSWFRPLDDVMGKLAGVVSNPPYIPSNEIVTLQAEVSRHEPRLALDGGEMGMGALLHLCEGLASALRAGGIFVFETNGDSQCEIVADILSSKSNFRFCNVKIVADFAGIYRFVTGIRR